MAVTTKTNVKGSKIEFYVYSFIAETRTRLLAGHESDRLIHTRKKEEEGITRKFEAIAMLVSEAIEANSSVIIISIHNFNS